MKHYTDLKTCIPLEAGEIGAASTQGGHSALLLQDGGAGWRVRINILTFPRKESAMSCASLEERQVL